MVNILIYSAITLCVFLFGSICGALFTANAVVKTDKLYEAETGNSFVKWVFDTQNTLRKHRIDINYAAE